MRRALHTGLAIVALLCLPAVATVSLDASYELPILLVHGFCSDSGTWSDMVASLQPSARYGTSVTRLYAGRTSATDPTFSVFQKETGGLSRTVFPSADSSKRLFAIDFYNDSVGSFDPARVNDTGINHKAAELSAVIKEVARISAASQVIVISHSLGGLAARSYVQGFAAATTAYPFTGDVAKIITIDTPHKGANTANLFLVPGLSQCIVESSPDRSDLSTGSSFLTLLNGATRVIPNTVDVSAIVSWDRSLGRAIGDVVVTFDQQSLATVSPYVNVSYITDWLNEITTRYSSVLHIAVHHVPETIALVRNLVSSFDAVVAAAPGAPGALTSSAGATTVGLFWNAPVTGGSVSSYVIEAGSSSGASDLASVDTGGTQTQFVASNIAPGTYYVRVRAKNAAGLGPPSNEIVLTFGQSCPIGAPSNLRAIVSGSLVTLSWATPVGSTPASYVLEAGSGPGLSNVVVADLPNSTTLTATGVAAGNYFVRVRSRNTCGVSSPSNEVTVTVGSL
jgi:pimeloyl-ACP methyl ester carboxylesterase